MRFLVIPCDTREISLGMSYAIRINSEVFPLEGTVFFLILSRFSLPFWKKKEKKNMSPSWTNDTRDDERAGENGVFLRRGYDASEGL